MNRIRMLVIASTLLNLPVALTAQRRPLHSESLTEISHAPTQERFRYDSERNTFVRFATNGRIDFLAETRDFLLSWVGLSGELQNVVWEPRNKIAAVVAAEVTFDPASGLYTYTYTVTNLGTSAQKLQTIYIGGDAIDQGIAPDEHWYSRRLTEFLRRGLQLSGGWAWSQTGGSLGIQPGDSLSGFKLVSSSPPGLLDCSVAGWTRAFSPSEVPPVELHAAIDAASFRLPRGVTVGPVVVDMTVGVAAEIRQVSDLLAKAERQGWLDVATSDDARATLAAAQQRLTALQDTAGVAESIADLLSRLDTPEYAGALSEGKAILMHRLRLVQDRIRRGAGG